MTAPQGRAVVDDRGVLTNRGGVLHAKAMGTVVTVCGVGTSSWDKHWDVPFTGTLDDDCPACVSRVASD